MLACMHTHMLCLLSELKIHYLPMQDSEIESQLFQVCMLLISVVHFCNTLSINNVSTSPLLCLFSYVWYL